MREIFERADNNVDLKVNNFLPEACEICGLHKYTNFWPVVKNIGSIFADMTPAEINRRWKDLQQRLADTFQSEEPDIKVILFLIGVQELGKGPRKFSKRQKEELMHIATCRLFSELGFYELQGLDQDGWPHWKLAKPIPNYTLLEQEMLLKSLIINYFEENT